MLSLFQDFYISPLSLLGKHLLKVKYGEWDEGNSFVMYQMHVWWEKSTPRQCSAISWNSLVVFNHTWGCCYVSQGYELMHTQLLIKQVYLCIHSVPQGIVPVSEAITIYHIWYDMNTVA